MHPFVRNSPYTGSVQAVILDWAGTAIDYGCRGPVAVFISSFQQFDVTVTADQARRFMGWEKKDHIRGMLALPEVAQLWEARHGGRPDENDVAAVYGLTEPMMVAAIADHCDLIPGLLEFAGAMRDRGIKIGSSTGYTRPMMDVLVPMAARRGYQPDVMHCSSDVPAGRPYPWMCYRNAIELGVYPLEAMVKIGDTISDIEEGLNAGMWTIGLTQSGNEMGLGRAEVEALSETELSIRLQSIERRYRQAGAHYVAAGIWECLPLIAVIEERLKQGERP